MKGEILGVMCKNFVVGFYRAHSGLLLFSFAMLMSYFFLINTLGTVRPEVIDYWQFFFAVNIASDPLFLVGFCLLCLFYMVKAYHYLLGQLKRSEYSFLSQSLACLPRVAQIGTWILVYLQISLPLFLFSMYFLIVGILFGHFMLPSILLSFACVLVLWSSIMTYRYLCTPREATFSFVLRFVFDREKPISCLYLFEVIYRFKTSLFLSKLLSCLLLSTVPKLVSSQERDSRILLFTGSIVVMVHVALIYQERNFRDKYLGFLLNLPIPFMERFVAPLFAYAVFLLPEILSMTYSFSLISSVGVLMFIFSLLSLFRSLVMIPGLRIKSFLVLIFSVFFVFYLLIMLGFGWYAIPIALLGSLALFTKNYLTPSMVD